MVLLNKIKIRFLLFSLMIFFSNVPVNAEWWYGNIAGYQIGRKTLDLCKFAIIDSHSRFGIGTTLFSYYYPENKLTYERYDRYTYYDESGGGNYREGWRRTSGEADWGLGVIFPLELYFVPYSWKAGNSFYSKNNDGVGTLYFYGTFSWWAATMGSDEFVDSFDIGGTLGSFFSDIGIGINLSKILTFKIGHQTISTPNFAYDYDYDYNYKIKGYDENKWTVGIDIYLGGWEQSNYESRTYGFIPWIAEPIREAKDERERAKPVIYSIKPEKGTAGTEVKFIGSNFRSEEKATSVYFNNVKANIEKLASDYIIAKVPAGVASGEAEVKIETSKGASNTEKFFVVPSKPPRLSITNLTFNDEDGDKILSAMEKGKIVFNIVNSEGAGESFGIKVKPKIADSKLDLKYSSVIEVGDVYPAKDKKVEIPVSAGLDLPPGQAEFLIQLEEANGFNPEPVKIRFQTHKLEPPKIELAEVKIDDGFYPDKRDKLSVGNNNGVIELGESVEIVATIINNGTGPTKNSVANIICNEAQINLLTPIEKDLGNIEPSDKRQIQFAFSITKRYSGTQLLPIKLVVNDERERFNTELPVKLSLGKKYSQLEVVDIQGIVPQAKPFKIVSAVPKTETTQNVIKITNLAVADFAGKNVSQADASIVTDFLRTELVNMRKFNIVEKGNMDKILAEAAFQQTGCTEVGCAVQIGKVLNVGQMIIGTLSKLVDTYHVTVSLVDVETGLMLTSETEHTKSADKLNKIAKELAKKLAKTMEKGF
ncbi:MAG: IPT/TIG domain-containing protein [Elusimicrobia bacterium]|nr:IPT/TIG domain-containing protein [Elusimicrobiota bacterium]